MSISMQNEIKRLKEKCENLEYLLCGVMEGHIALTARLTEIESVSRPPLVPSKKKSTLTRLDLTNGTHAHK